MLRAALKAGMNCTGQKKYDQNVRYRRCETYKLDTHVGDHGLARRVDGLSCCWPDSVVAVGGVILNTRVDEREKHGDGHRNSRDDAHKRDVLEGAGNAEHQADDRGDDLEDYGALGVVRERIENLASCEDMEAAQE